MSTIAAAGADTEDGKGAIPSNGLSEIRTKNESSARMKEEPESFLSNPGTYMDDISCRVLRRKRVNEWNYEMVSRTILLCDCMGL